ncbi:hypothetical protein CVV26_03475, partial [Candidatus Kuenenbacteria bacterium HGW-Kuenenbacteria-1]
SIDGTGNSNVSAFSGDLALSTLTSGNVNITSAGTIGLTGNTGITGTLAVSGITQIGGGYSSTGTTITDTGNISANGNLIIDGTSTLTGKTTIENALDINANVLQELVTYDKVLTALAPYGENEFSITRNITGGTNNLSGDLLRVIDTSTTTGINTANLLNLLVNSDEKFTVDTTGKLVMDGDLRVGSSTYLGDSNSDTTTIRGQIILTDSSSTYPILFGTDTNLYRSSSDTLKTDDNLEVVLTTKLLGTTQIGGGYGSTGVTISDNGNIDTNGNLRVNGTTNLGDGSGNDDVTIDTGADGYFRLTSPSLNISSTGNITNNNANLTIKTFDTTGTGDYNLTLDADSGSIWLASLDTLKGTGDLILNGANSKIDIGPTSGTTAVSNFYGPVAIGSATIPKTLTTNGFLDAKGAVNLGDGEDAIIINGSTLTVNDNILPGGVYSLGDATHFWDTAYITNLNVTSSNIGGSLYETFTINADNATADLEDVNLAFERGTTTPNAIIKWDATNDRFDFNQPVYLQNNLTVTGATTLNGNTLVSGTNTFTVGTGATILNGTATLNGTTIVNSTL